MERMNGGLGFRSMGFMALEYGKIELAGRRTILTGGGLLILSSRGVLLWCFEVLFLAAYRFNLKRARQCSHNEIQPDTSPYQHR